MYSSGTGFQVTLISCGETELIAVRFIGAALGTNEKKRFGQDVEILSILLSEQQFMSIVQKMIDGKICLSLSFIYSFTNAGL